MAEWTGSRADAVKLVNEVAALVADMADRRTGMAKAGRLADEAQALLIELKTRFEPNGKPLARAVPVS
jgi:hypothetical protein